MLKRFRSIYFTSPNQPWTLGGKTKLDFTGWIEVAQDGKRVIIDGFEIHCMFNISNEDAGGAPLLAADTWRFVRNVTVEQKDGVKRYDEIDGASLRVHNYAVLGAPRVRESYDVPVTNGGEEGNIPVDVAFSFYVPLMKPYADEPYDYCMPADVFRQLRVAMAQDDDLSVGDEGSDSITINSGVYWVVAVCHLEAEAKLYATDEVTVMDFKTQKQTDINVTGRPHDLLMYLPGSGGGAPISNVTDAQVLEIYDQSRLVYPDLVVDYARERDLTPGLFGTTDQSPVHIDPFVPDPADGSGTNAATNPRALALLLTTGNHPDEGPVRENLTVKTNQTSDAGTPYRLVMRAVTPRSQKLDAAVARKYGATAQMPDRDASEKKIAPKDASYFPAKLAK